MKITPGLPRSVVPVGRRAVPLLSTVPRVRSRQVSTRTSKAEKSKLVRSDWQFIAQAVWDVSAVERQILPDMVPSVGFLAASVIGLFVMANSYKGPEMFTFMVFGLLLVVLVSSGRRLRNLGSLSRKVLLGKTEASTGLLQSVLRKLMDQRGLSEAFYTYKDLLIALNRAYEALDNCPNLELQGRGWSKNAIIQSVDLAEKWLGEWLVDEKPPEREEKVSEITKGLRKAIPLPLNPSTSE